MEVKNFLVQSETPTPSVEQNEITLESGEKIVEKELCNAIRKVFSIPGSYAEYARRTDEDLTILRNGY